MFQKKKGLFLIFISFIGFSCFGPASDDLSREQFDEKLIVSLQEDGFIEPMELNGPGVEMLLPADGQVCVTSRPEFIIRNSSLGPFFQYDFEICDDVACEFPVTRAFGVASGQFEVTSWSCNIELSEGVLYFWRVREVSLNRTGLWSRPSAFVVNHYSASEDEYAEQVVYCDVQCATAVLYNDCTEALGAPDYWSEVNPQSLDGFDYYGFVSLGVRGTLIVDMGPMSAITDGYGADFKVWQAVSREQFHVYIAEQASGPWFDLGFGGTGWMNNLKEFEVQYLDTTGMYPAQSQDSWCYTTADGRGGEIAWCDVSGSGLSQVRYVRIVDESPWADLRKDCFFLDESWGSFVPYLTAGADIDSIEAL